MIQRLLDKLSALNTKQLLIMAGVAGCIMFAAIFAGVSYLTNTPVEQPPAEETKPAVETVAVVVAKTNLPPRTRIQESMLQIKELPADIVPEGAIKSFADVLNVQIKVSIFAGDILTIQKVFAEGDEGFTGSIPSDCRAVSISVNDITGVAGFAKPGDRVDLLLVEKGKYSATSNLLLQNVPLLSINQDTTGAAPVSENGVPKAAISNPSIATFALRPEETLKLISAVKLGEIYLSLRPSKPQSAYVEPMKYTMDSIDAPQPEPEPEYTPAPVIPSSAPAPAPQLPIEPATPKIEIIAGDQVVQSATPTLPAGGPISSPAPTTSQPLPAIPSRGVPQEFNSPQVPHVPLADSPVISR